jgi:hypothetical protein
MTFLSDVRSLDAYDAELVLERAAIMEFCGNLPRGVAERLAMNEVEQGACNGSERGTVSRVQGRERQDVAQ